MRRPTLQVDNRDPGMLSQVGASYWAELGGDQLSLPATVPQKRSCNTQVPQYQWYRDPDANAITLRGLGNAEKLQVHQTLDNTSSPFPPVPCFHLPHSHAEMSLCAHDIFSQRSGGLVRDSGVVPEAIRSRSICRDLLFAAPTLSPFL